MYVCMSPPFLRHGNSWEVDALHLGRVWVRDEAFRFLGQSVQLLHHNNEPTKYYISRHFGEGGSHGKVPIVKHLYKIETCSFLYSSQEMQSFLSRKPCIISFLSQDIVTYE